MLINCLNPSHVRSSVEIFRGITAYRIAVRVEGQPDAQANPPPPPADDDHSKDDSMNDS